MRRFINFGKYLAVGSWNQIIINQVTDIFLLAHFLGLRGVGLYSIAFGLPYKLASLSPSRQLEPVLNPVIVRRYTETSSKKELTYYFQLINKVTFFITIPSFVFILLLADKVIIYVLDPEYLVITDLFRLSIGFLMVNQFVYAYSTILFTLEEGKKIFILSLVSVYNLIMDIILIPIYGVLGAIIATGSVGIIQILYSHYALKKTINLPYPWRSFGRYSINTLISALVVFSMRDFISDILSLFLVLVVGGLVYLVASYINKGFEEKDRKLLNDAIGRKIWVF